MHGTTPPTAGSIGDTASSAATIEPISAPQIAATLTGAGPPPLLVNLQVLRAVSALLVVLFHARVVSPAGTLISFEFGNAGVDIFFFISGFIIAHVASADRSRPGRFLLKRAIRVIPLYWAMTLALFLAAQVAPAIISGDSGPGIAELAQSLLFLPHLNPEGEMLPILFVGWTLNFEMFFYLLFVATLWLRNRAARCVMLSIVIVALVAVGLVFQPSGPIGATYTDALMVEFAIGAWIATAYHAGLLPRLGAAGRLLWVAVALAGFVGLVWADYHFPNAPRELKWGGPAFLIVGAALILESGGAALGWRWVQTLGAASYAIYLSHPFVIKAMALIYAALAFPNVALQWIAIGLAVAIAAGVGVAFHQVVERPLIRVTRRWLLPGAAAPAA